VETVTTRPRLLVLNQYYWPGVEATANLLAELCEALADEYDVTVVTGAVPGAPEPGRFERNGVRVIRVSSTSYERRRLSRRALNYVTYVTAALREALATPRPDVVLCMTDPPFIGDIAHVVARRFDAPLVVISQDVFPEIAVALGRLENRFVVGVLRVLVAFYLRRADRVVAIGETMQRRLEKKGVGCDRIRVIPNWADARAIEPLPRDNEWARAQDLVGRFVVMHFGNVGHAQDLDSLVRATTFLRDLDDLVVPIVGVGARQADLTKLAQRLEADKIRFLPWQPYETRAQPLSAADVHVVGLGHGLAGYIVPSRFYGIVAAGRPVIVAADQESETAKVVREVGCGVVVPPGRPDRMAAAIRSAYDGRLDLAEMGRRAREYAVNEGDRAVAVRRYRELLREVRQSADGLGSAE
jgi:colanic acid biosynthesis glycosyl transferase WcaI